MIGRIRTNSIPNNLHEALTGLHEYGHIHKNLSMTRIAEGISQPNPYQLYKWFANGRLPTVFIRPLEETCGIPLITRYLCQSAGLMAIPIPKGTTTTVKEINELSLLTSQTIALMMKYAEGEAKADETLHAITEVMQGFAWQRNNIAKHAQPDFDF